MTALTVAMQHRLGASAMTRRAGGLEPPKRIEGITPRTGQTVAHSSTIRHPFMKPYIISTSFLQGTGMTMIPLDAAMAKHCASPCLLRALPEIRNLTTQPSPSASTISSIVIATLPSLIPPPLLRRKDLRIFWNFCDCRWPDRSGQSSSKNLSGSQQLSQVNTAMLHGKSSIANMLHKIEDIEADSRVQLSSGAACNL